MSMFVGEALCGEGNEVAHIDLLIGDKSGPVGVAFAKHWKFPEILITSIEKHHQKKYDDNIYLITFSFKAKKGEKLLLIYLANKELVYWSVRPSSRRGGDKFILACCVFLFIREH